MKVKVILNPYSGRWNGQKRREEVEKTLHAAGVNFDLVLTEYHGHGIKLASEAAMEGYDAVIAGGGDGSISEVVNGLMNATVHGVKMPHLGILPLGTANDLVSNLGLPHDLKTSSEIIARGFTRPVDLGQLKYKSINSEGETTGVCYFDNNSAIGLEPCVTLVQQKISWLKGTIRYLVSAVVAVMQKPSWQANITWENGSYQGPISLVTVGNGKITGGFYMTPHANPFDGKLTFVYGYVSNRRSMFALLPRALKPGKGSYVEAEEIHELDSPWMRVNVSEPTPLHADGEIQTETAVEIEWRIIPAALTIFSQT